MNPLRDRCVQLFAPLFVLLLFSGCTCGPYCGPGPALNESAFMQVVNTLCAPEMEGRDAGTDGIVLARDFLVDQYRRAGLQPAFVIDGKPSYIQPFKLKIGTDAEDQPIEVTIHNVGGLLPGVGALAEQVVVVGGHYDHVGYGHIGSRAKERKGEIHPGADDNASGTAGVVLLARHFAWMKQDPIAPRRTILFTGFAGEERGLHGSRFMTKHPEQLAFDGEQMIGMINMDMVGRLRNDELYAFGDSSGQQWRTWTTQANESIGLVLKWDVRPPGGSDHSMFIAAGVSAIFFNTWLHPDYHTPNDTPDKVNAAGGVKVLALVAGLLEQAASTQETLVYVSPKPKAPRPYLGASLGEHEQGVLLEGVVPKGPMEKAGALKGDVLVSLGGQAIASASDVRTFLTKAKSGDEVVAQLLRGEEKIELNIRLDTRR